MKIISAIFARGVAGKENLPKDTLAQVAFIGRSNVGKSSVINSLTGKKNLARSSSTPGRTQEVNFFLINGKFYLADLPGYGYAHGDFDKKDKLWDLIQWYLIHSGIEHKKVVLIIDAKVGPTDDDIYMLGLLEENKKDIVIVANKIDKLTKNELRKSLDAIKGKVGPYPIIAYSAEKHVGEGELLAAITN
jgi:GTP-binding protein